jgi:hypothetical protein
MKKYQIQVRSEGKTISNISRKLYAKQIGNFNPLFCRFDNKTFQVKSDSGDTSDPFRREESYSNSFYIELEKACSWNL